MSNPRNCALCGSREANFQQRSPLVQQIRCPRCGDYTLFAAAEDALRRVPIQNKGAVSGWIRRQNAMGLVPYIEDHDFANYLSALTKPPFRERVEQYLLAVAARASKLGETFFPVADDLIGTSYSDDANEVDFILEYLRQEGFVDLEHQTAYYLTPRGYISADELRTRRAASSQAFVAMWFTDEMKKIYDEAIEPAIRSAGFSPMLISSKEHANKIDDEIIAEIRRSAFLVADFTGHRQNVYFETGFAIGLARQPIWTCRKDHIKDLHFDIRQYNCIDWQNAAELAQRLQRRIEAMFGRGPLAVP
jgi:nucleoside 2-deoxyribosyltransferase